MKKVIKFLCLAMVCVVCLSCVSGCNNQPELLTADEVAEALRDAGYSDAHVTNDIGTEVLFSPNSSSHCEYISFAPLFILFDELDENKRYIYKSGFYDYSFALKYIDINKDYSKILDVIMPFFDKEYENNGAEIMNQLLMYKDNSKFVYVDDDSYVTESVVYERDEYTVSYRIFKFCSDGYNIEIDIY